MNSTRVRVCIKHVIFKIVCVHMHMHTQVPSESRRGCEIPGAGVPGGGESPDLGARH